MSNNNNNSNNNNTKLNNLKNEVAREHNINLNQGGNIKAKDAGAVGGNMVKKMVNNAKNNMQDNNQ